MRGKIVNDLLAKVGLRIVRYSPNYDHFDIGRDYRDSSHVVPNFTLRPAASRDEAPDPTIFKVDNGRSAIEIEVFYSHLTLLKMLKHFEFKSVLDIGSHAQNITNIFRHVGKHVTTIEVAPGYEADYKTDYLDTQFPAKFDAIWCSQTLEHQRDVGGFLDKMFDDLNDGGVLALTVPIDMSPSLAFGHCNRFTPLTLLYHVILAGFDCRDVSVKCYNWNIGLIVRKKYNGIRRHSSFALVPNTPDKQTISHITKKSVKATLGDEIFEGMSESFPLPLTAMVLEWAGDSINWGNPI